MGTNQLINTINDLIQWGKKYDSEFEVDQVSDGYHNFDELYQFRLQYNAALFNLWAASGQHKVHKSRRHYDGDLCFGGEYFIVIAITPVGQISNHYHNRHWDLFNIPELYTPIVRFDGHTSNDVLNRLNALNLSESLQLFNADELEDWRKQRGYQQIALNQEEVVESLMEWGRSRLINDIHHEPPKLNDSTSDC